MRQWWSTNARGVQTFTFSREMTPEEIEETTRRMDAAFAHMDKAFGEMGEMFDNLAKADTHPEGRDSETWLGSWVARCRKAFAR